MGLRHAGRKLRAERYALPWLPAWHRRSLLRRTHSPLLLAAIRDANHYDGAGQAKRRTWRGRREHGRGGFRAYLGAQRLTRRVSAFCGGVLGSH